MTSNCQLLIIGAGAAGIGAAHAARAAGLDYQVVEASHRVGGRALTEELAPGIPWDLGCHWLHSGSINPLAPIADKLGIHYEKTSSTRAFYLQGRKLPPQEEALYYQYSLDIWRKVELLQHSGQDVALGDLIDHDSPWAPYYTYWQSLMTSKDVDSFSALDLILYEDTDENWPVQEGYGTLLQRHAEVIPVTLNTRVERIDWGNEGVVVSTNRGTIRAEQVVITVSTGVLSARDIIFQPALPVATQEAITSLTPGCYNNFAMLYEEPELAGRSAEQHAGRPAKGQQEEKHWPFDSDTPDRIDYSDGDDINFAFKLRCSGWPYIYCAVAGRQAEWLERQPVEESQELMMTALISIFGSDFRKKIIKFKSSAWGNDPLVKGAYSASSPGQAHQRKALATPVAERLHFAGEAASEKAFCTAHGAWQSGRDAVQKCQFKKSID